jgi:hypothetical protein
MHQSSVLEEYGPVVITVHQAAPSDDDALVEE